MGELKRTLASLEFGKYNNIKGYSNLKYPFTFKPKEVGPIDIKLILYFEKIKYSPQIIITIKGECIKVPIYIERPIYNFEIIVMSYMYREELVFYNRSSNTMKVHIVAPKETRRFFEFIPKLGYI